jgi:hypothetical protein
MATVYGAQDLDEREEIVGLFADGFLRLWGPSRRCWGRGPTCSGTAAGRSSWASPPSSTTSSRPIHRLCASASREVWIDIVFSESQREEVENLMRKWASTRRWWPRWWRSSASSACEAAMAQALTRAPGARERIEAGATGYPLANNDCVWSCRGWRTDSVDLIVTSIPFGTQYEYSPSYNDFGHTDDNAHFWAQMDFLIAELLRVLAPGRVAAIHVKDRIVPGGLTGLGFQTVYPFADDCRAHFRKAGFAYLGEKTNLTDVVRENNQTYRLGWSEQLKDGSRMGAGLPEKVLLFRKPPSDRSNGYADRPVEKPMAMPSLFDLLGLRGGEDDGDDFPGEREGEAA